MVDGYREQAEISRRKILKGVSGTVGGLSAVSGFPETSSTAGEPVALQYFHEDWTTISGDMDRVADWGFDAIWIQQPTEGAVTKEEQKGRNDPPLGYQPLDLRNFNSELGTESELTTLIDTAHDNDVDVYLDTVLNHMAAEPVSAFPWFGSNDFHNNGGIDDDAYTYDPNNSECFDANGDPKDPDRIECKPFQVENHDLLGLKDLKQDKQYVRDQLFRYMEDMKELGADGYRFDAVKHIPESFFGTYANQWAEDMNMFRVGEILIGSTQYIDGYVNAGPGMHAFDYPLFFVLKGVFDSSNPGDMRNLEGAGLVAQNPLRAMPFVDNHDKTPPSQYDLAHAFVLTIEGYPLLYNIFPNWLLDYDPIKNMVWVKKNLAGGDTIWKYTDSDLAIYERDSNLLVGLNNSGSQRTQSVSTSWTDTELKDYAGNAGNVTTDANGNVDITVPGNDSSKKSVQGWVFYAPAAQDIAVGASGETGIQQGTNATISLSGEQVEQIVIENLWTDWTLSSENPDGGTVTDDISSAGKVTIDYSSLQASVSPSITVSLPDRYVGGEYSLTVTASNSDESSETTATISIA